MIAAAKEAQDETENMQFQTDFVLMAGILTPLIAQLMKALGRPSQK